MNLHEIAITYDYGEFLAINFSILMIEIRVIAREPLK